MAQHTFITGINVSKVGLCGYGVLTDVEYYDDTIDVLTKSDIRKLVTDDIDLQNRKLAKAAEKNRLASARSTPPPGSAGSPLSEGAGKKQKKRAVVQSSKKKTTTKKTTAVRRTKGAQPCRKK